MSLVIDSHQHFWQRNLFDFRWLEDAKLKPIQRDFLPEDLAPLLQEAGVQKTLFVQTQHNLAENDWVLGLAEKHAWIAGVVGWVDLAGENCEAQILAYKDRAKFVGVRHVVQDEPDLDFLQRTEILRGLGLLEKHDVAYDLLVYPKQLRHAAELAKRFPKLRMVIDHLGKPNIKEHRMEGWRDDLAAAAQHGNVYCKLSGMVTEADWQSWTPDHLRPYVDYALELFGAKRCMYGSDWPVCLLAGSYQRVLDALRECTKDLSAAEKESIFHGTATDFYRLKNV